MKRYDKYKDSGIEWIGEIPEHWVVKKNKFLFKSLNTKRIPLSAEERGVMEKKLYDYYGASGVIDQVEDYLFDEELMTFAMGNCIVMEDTNGNRKLLKKRYDAKIDAVAAMLDAYVAYKINREAFD